jgi:hypothetical protein
VKKLISVTFLILIFCVGLCNANAQESRIGEKLPDGDYIVIINGVEYRAITADQVRQIAEDRLELDKLRRKFDQLQQLTEQLTVEVSQITKDRDLANAMIAFEQQQKNHYKSLFEGEHSLRVAADKFKLGKVTKFFDHPAVQIGTKIVWQGAITWLSLRRSN